MSNENMADYYKVLEATRQWTMEYALLYSMWCESDFKGKDCLIAGKSFLLRFLEWYKIAVKENKGYPIEARRLRHDIEDVINNITNCLLRSMTRVDVFPVTLKVMTGWFCGISGDKFLSLLHVYAYWCAAEHLGSKKPEEELMATLDRNLDKNYGILYEAYMDSAMLQEDPKAAIEIVNGFSVMFKSTKKLAMLLYAELKEGGYDENQFERGE